MRKQDIPFWALVVALICGVSLHWPAWSRLVAILLAGTVLVQVISRFFDTYGKESHHGRK